MVAWCLIHHLSMDLTLVYAVPSVPFHHKVFCGTFAMANTAPWHALQRFGLGAGSFSSAKNCAKILTMGSDVPGISGNQLNLPIYLPVLFGLSNGLPNTKVELFT